MVVAQPKVMRLSVSQVRVLPPRLTQIANDMNTTNRAEQFDRDFERFKKEYDPRWEEHLTDSTFFELEDWYDGLHNLGSEEENSDEAYDFAIYVWDKIHENEPRLEMKVRESYDGLGYYTLQNMTEDELRSLLVMIKGACLEERRVFNRVKVQIEKILEK